MDDNQSTPLAGLTVLQCDCHAVTSFAAHILRMLGATVVRATGDRAQFEGDDRLFQLLNPRASAGAAAGLAEVVLAGPSTGADAARRAAPGAVVVRATAPPSLDTELTLQAASGWLASTGDRGHGNTPLRMPGHTTSFHAAALLALLAVAAARQHRLAGEPHEIVLDLREAAVLFANLVAQYTHTGTAVWRHAGSRQKPTDVFQCADGPLFVSCVEERHWQELLALLGNPPWGPDFGDRFDRFDRWAELQPLIAAALAPLSREDVYRGCMARHIPTVPFYSVDELVQQPQLQGRGVLVAGDGTPRPRLPWLTTAGTGAAADDAPGPPLTAPLSDVLLVDMSQVWAGPFCAELLAALGALAVKVESRKNVDLYRRISGQAVAGDINTAGGWNQLNQGKLSIVLEPNDAADRATLRALLDCADAFVANFRPGSSVHREMADELRGRGGMVEVAISGFGETGPWAENGLYGLGASMVGGLGRAVGREDGPMQGPGLAFGDPCTGVYAALAAAAAIFDRDTSGAGAHIDVAMCEALLFNLTDLFSEATATGTAARRGNRHEVFVPQGVYRCAGDDDWVALTVRSDSEWATLAALVGEPGWAALDGDGRRLRHDEIDAAIGAWCGARGRDEADAALRAAGITASRMFEAGELVKDPELRARGALVRMAHPATGTRVMVGLPWTIDGVRTVLRPAPLLDGDRQAVLDLVAGRAGRAHQPAPGFAEGG